MRKILGKHPNFEFFSHRSSRGWITCTEELSRDNGRAEVEQ
jgi:hypothetical protein